MPLIASPGQRHGPCRSCTHDKCAEARAITQTICHLCGDAIGFDRGYCFEDYQDNRPVHIACLAAHEDQASRPRLRPLVYTKADAAALLGIGESTLSEYQSRGEIAYIKLGTRTLFRPEHLTAFLNRFTLEPRRSLRRAS